MQILLRLELIEKGIELRVRMHFSTYKFHYLEEVI